MLLQHPAPVQESADEQPPLKNCFNLVITTYLSYDLITEWKYKHVLKYAADIMQKLKADLASFTSITPMENRYGGSSVESDLCSCIAICNRWPKLLHTPLPVSQFSMHSHQISSFEFWLTEVVLHIKTTDQRLKEKQR